MSSTSETMTTTDEHQRLGLSQENPAHFPLLHLPRELRDRVYIELLKGRLALSPPSFSDVFQGHRKAIRRDGNRVFFDRVMYAPFPTHISYAPSQLLLNRQVHGEVKEVLLKNGLEIRPLTYILDCVAVHDGVLYPTWLSVPVLSSHVDIVEANLRLYETARYGWQGWVVGDGGPARMVWSLLALLNRFLSRGADFLSEPPKATSTTVGLVVLNVVTQPEGGLSGRTAQGETRLDRIIEWIGNFIGILLIDDYGEMMREKVRVIRLCVDGVEREVFDVRHANKENAGLTV